MIWTYKRCKNEEIFMLFSIKNIHGKIGFVSKGSEMMTFDYKKEYKEFYMPKKNPIL